MGEYDISQWRLAGTYIHTPSDPKMATGVRTGFTRDRLSHPACCAMLWVGFQSVRVSSPRYRGHILKRFQVSSCAWPQMHLPYLADTWIEQRAYHRWYWVRRGSC